MMLNVTGSKRKRALVAALTGLLAIMAGLSVAAPEVTKKDAEKRAGSPGPAIPLKFGRSIPLAVQSAGVEWRGNTYHLLGLGSIQFNLDKRTSRLKAEIAAGVTGFDDVNYDVSAAVFDATGALLGAARTRCRVHSMWAGMVASGPQTIDLDFGVSLDYANAATFMVSISKRKVMTPDQWPKK
jgi:hypothetical protein